MKEKKKDWVQKGRGKKQVSTAGRRKKGQRDKGMKEKGNEGNRKRKTD